MHTPMNIYAVHQFLIFLLGIWDAFASANRMNCFANKNNKKQKLLYSSLSGHLLILLVAGGSAVVSFQVLL